MFYKNNDYWYRAERVEFPDGTVLDENNKQSLDGWEWYDTPPDGYTENSSDFERIIVIPRSNNDD